MARKATKKGKAEIIRDYLTKNPTHTWKAAEVTLKKHGIGSAYFAMTKSKVKNKAAPKAKTGSTASVKKSGSTNVVIFARACGGIDKAIAALEDLKKMQV